MQQSRSLKIGWLTVLFLFFINIFLTLLLPSKPLEIIEIIKPASVVNPQIKVTFSKKVDKESILNGFSINPKIKGNFSWSGNTLFFTPEDNLNFNQNYTLTLNQKIQTESGEFLDKNYQETINAYPLKIAFINENEELVEYDNLTEQIKTITPQNLKIKNFDYDSSLKKFLLLATEDQDSINEIFTLDPESGSIKKIKALKKNYFKYHFAKWLPTENAIIVSRSKIRSINEDDGSVASISDKPEDTELLIYGLDDKFLGLITTGQNFIYEYFPTPEGKNIGFIDSYGSFLIKNLESGEEIMVANQFDKYFGFSKNGTYTIFENSQDYETAKINSKLLLINQKGEKKEITIAQWNGNISSIDFSQNEENLFLSYNNELLQNSIFQHDLQKNTTKKIYETTKKILDLKISPDSKFIIFTLTSENNSSINIFNLEERSLKTLKYQGSKAIWLY